MAQEETIKLFENSKVRIVWDDEKEKYFFSIVDVIQVLTDSVDGRKYWNKLKQRLREEGNETVTNCHQLTSPKRYNSINLHAKCRFFCICQKIVVPLQPQRFQSPFCWP